MKENRALLSFASFAALGTIWGSNFLLMKIACQYISPSQVLLIRIICGCIPVAVYAVMTKSLRWSHLRFIHRFTVMALFNAVLYLYAFIKGTNLLYSGIAGAISGAVPLFSFILGIIFLAEEKLSNRRILGIGMGMFGVVLIANPSGENLFSSNIVGIAYMLAGCISFGFAFVYAKKYIIPLQIPSSALTTYQLFIASIILLFITDYNGITKLYDSIFAVLAVVIGMGFLGSGFAFLIYYYLVKKLGAITASSVTFVPPVIALLIGSFIANEPISVLHYGGTFLILTGVFFLRN